MNRTGERGAAANRSKECWNQNDGVKKKHSKKGNLPFVPLLSLSSFFRVINVRSTLLRPPFSKTKFRFGFKRKKRFQNRKKVQDPRLKSFPATATAPEGEPAAAPEEEVEVGEDEVYLQSFSLYFRFRERMM